MGERPSEHSQIEQQNLEKPSENESPIKWYKTLEYLKTVYPELDLESLQPAITEIIQRSRNTKDKVVDVSDICRRHNIEKVVVVENLCLLAFNARIAAELIKRYPKGNAHSIEIDGGGVIITHGASSLIADNILHFEYLETGKSETQQWLETSGKAGHNWDSYLKFMLEALKNDPETRKILEERSNDPDETVKDRAVALLKLLEGNNIDEYKEWIKSKVDGKILKGDIFKRNFGQDPSLLKDKADVTDASNRAVFFDLVSSNFTSESATNKKAQWFRGMINLADSVKPGGHLILTACLEANHYFVDKEEMPAVPVNSENIRKLLSDKGFDIVFEQETTQDSDPSLGYQKLGFFFAQKKS